jgi:Flp pilus assembly protein TadB
MSPIVFLISGVLSALLAFLMRGSLEPEVLIAGSVAVSSSLPVLMASGLGPEAPFRFASSSLGSPVFQRVLPRAQRMVRAAMAFRESEEFAARISLVIVGGALSALGVLAAAAISGVPLVAVASVIGFVPLFEFLSVSSKASSRREWTEAELPFFTTLAVALISAGMSFYYVLKRASELSYIFRQVRKEALLVVRNVEVVGMGVLEAMEEAAEEEVWS